MDNLFLKSKKTSKIDSETKEILDSLEDIKIRLDYAELCLNFTNNELLIDSIIYEIMSLQKKYAYFLQKVKTRGIVVSELNILQKFPAS